jgi:hypothetical protein
VAEGGGLLTRSYLPMLQVFVPGFYPVFSYCKLLILRPANRPADERSSAGNGIVLVA